MYIVGAAFISPYPSFIIAVLSCEGLAIKGVHNENNIKALCKEFVKDPQMK